MIPRSGIQPNKSPTVMYLENKIILSGVLYCHNQRISRIAKMSSAGEFSEEFCSDFSLPSNK